MVWPALGSTTVFCVDPDFCGMMLMVLSSMTWLMSYHVIAAALPTNTKAAATTLTTTERAWCRVRYPKLWRGLG